tara:strand:- start:101 stop:388 length:288 start_codon:yes stop_codon:yes gene_type:complete
MKKPLGATTYIGVSLKDLNEYFKEDAVIHVSKKFLIAYNMIAGITEQSKAIQMNVSDNTDKVKESAIKIEQVDIAVEPEKEAAPPVELNVSNGDW